MKKVILFFITLFVTFVLRAQVPCPNDNTFWLDLTPTGVGNTNTSFCTYAGDYDTFTACNGTQYGISVCGGSYNSAVTMYSNTGTLLYSQNAVSGNGCETFTWTSTISGVVRVLVDIASCGTNSVCTQVSITQLTSCGTSTPSGNQDCSNSILVCNDVSFSGNSSGAGTQELNAGNQGCMSTEHQSSWYVFQIATSGTLALNITTAVDYDFAIWGPNVSCGALGTPVRCSWAAGGGNTGLGNGATDMTEGAGGDRWVQTLAVTAGQTYIMLIDNFTANSTSFTLDWTMTGGASLKCTPLPIELILFTGENFGDYNLLKWLTATETNNDYFTLEKSYDGVVFDFVGKVDGAGNSVELKSYNLTDNKINDITYYRLKQTDFNGENKTSSLIAVTRNTNEKEFKIIKITNVLGQEVTDDTDGVKIYYFSNGTVLKKYDMKER